MLTRGRERRGGSSPGRGRVSGPLGCSQSLGTPFRGADRAWGAAGGQQIHDQAPPSRHAEVHLGSPQEVLTWGERGVQSQGFLIPLLCSLHTQPSPVHTSAFRENAFLPLQSGPPLNDRVTEGHLQGQGAGLKNCPFLPHQPQAPPRPPGSQPEPPVSIMEEPEWPREMDPMSSSVPVGRQAQRGESQMRQGSRDKGTGL